MQLNIHHPKMNRIATLGEEQGKLFHTVRLQDSDGGELVIFLDQDWSDWDEIVQKVEAYRRSTTGVAA